MTSNMTVARPRARLRMAALATLTLLGSTASFTAARAAPKDPRFLILPAIPGWFDGQPNLYTSTDTSDKATAEAGGLNYVPRLAAAANTKAVDDIYMITNFRQSNIVPSAPQPEGPGNNNHAYSPLWQLSKVTWVADAHPYLLKSEKDVLDAKSHGLVKINKTNIVINCSIIYSPSGGILPGAHIGDIGR